MPEDVMPPPEPTDNNTPPITTNPVVEAVPESAAPTPPAAEATPSVSESPSTSEIAPAAPVSHEATPPPPVSNEPAATGKIIVGSGRRKRPVALIVIILLVVALIVAGAVYWFKFRHTSTPHAATTGSTSTTAMTKTTTPTVAVGDLTLSTTKNYGDKYSSGLLPVGDGKYVTDAAKTGYIYACSAYAQNVKSSQGGASTRGPWFTNNNTQYDINKKIAVKGSVMWQADFSNNVAGSTRTIVTNDLPSHPTGTFPIATSDPAHAYDRNPNSIKGQTLTYALPASPSYSNPGCMGGEAGVMLTGVALFNAFDAGGRDAGAWEVQDSCNGHPQSEGEYHYHTLSSCIKNADVKTVIGFALDGFPITGPTISPGNVLTTADLDVCHGITSQITLDGKLVTAYHYVMTQDFPYSVSCFRGTATQPPGMQPTAD